jgi:hypothetical protein
MQEHGDFAEDYPGRESSTFPTEGHRNIPDYPGQRVKGLTQRRDAGAWRLCRGLSREGSETTFPRERYRSMADYPCRGVEGLTRERDAGSWRRYLGLYRSVIAKTSTREGCGRMAALLRTVESRSHEFSEGGMWGTWRHCQGLPR